MSGEELNLDEKPLIVEWQGRYYDVAKFAKRHPGGEKVLRKVAGEDIASYLSGSRRLLGVKHEHSPAALRILDKYAIDRHEQMSDALDLSTPILWKVGNLHDHYWTWIHQPSDGIIRLFESNFLEALTRTKWFMVPMVWMPVVLYFTAHALAHYYQLFGLLIGGLIWGILFAIGTLTWTLVEYTLHRNVFHWKPNPQSYNEITFHFLMHGLHHKTPMDGDRLVFPPTPALLIVGFFYMVYRSLLPWPVFCAFASGKLFGYICYDMIHFYLHHGSPKPTSNLHYRKVYHHNHHFKDFDAVVMQLRYYLDTSGHRVYTLKKADPTGTETKSAHPARFSPEDKFSQFRIIVKKRFGLLPTDALKPVF